MWAFAPRQSRNPEWKDRGKILERGLLKMDPERHACTWKNDAVTLTVTEFLILQALATRPGCQKSQCLDGCGLCDQVYVDDRTIDSHQAIAQKSVVDDEFESPDTLWRELLQGMTLTRQVNV